MTFICSLMAARSTTGSPMDPVVVDIKHVAIHINADDLDGAVAIGVQIAQRLWPEASGWTHHHANAQPLTDVCVFGKETIALAHEVDEPEGGPK